MAVQQEGALQQPPGAAQPGPAPNSASVAGPISNTQTQSPPSANQGSAGSSAQGQATGPNLDFSQLLEQQIAQAIQPVLDEFRQQVTQAVEQSQTPKAPASIAGGEGARQEAPQGQGAPSTVQQPPVPQPPSQAAQQAPTPHVQAPQFPLAEILRPAVQAAERQGEQWLQSLLVSGLTGLLTESTRAAIQQRAERGLHTLLQKLFEAAPDGFSNQEMQVRMEQTLQALLREALDAVFAESARTMLGQGGQQAIQESLHGDFGGALKQIQEALRAMVGALLAVLRRNWPTILRILIALALLAVASALAKDDKPQRGEVGQDGPDGRTGL